MPRIEPFEEHTDSYERWFEENADLYQAELEAVRGLLPPAGAEGMEVGVGTGRFAGPLGIKIGVEPSGRMAAKARARGIDVHSGVAEGLPFPDGRFDFILFVTTVCFVDDVLEAFEEAFRTLKDGGIIIVGFVDRESELGRKYLVKREQSRFYKHATFFSTREVIGYLKRAGFEVSGIRQTIVPGESPGTVLEGSGRGGFVVVKAVRGETV
jgi:SAM-dependent methyltransferase